MEVIEIEVEREATNPFVKSGLVRTPPPQTQQVQKQHTNEQQAQQQYSAWTKLPQPPRVEAAKKLVDELHEYVDKRSNVHKDIKALVIKLQGALVLIVLNGEHEARRAAQMQRAEADTATREVNTASNVPPGVQSTPFFTPKRPRASPGDVRPGGPKRHKDARVTGAKLPPEATDAVNSRTEWQVVGKKRRKRAKKPPKKRKVVRTRNKSEALIVKASDDSYAEVLRAMRMNPDLKELGEDVQKVRRTRNGEMLFELKRNPKAGSISYKELTEKALGNKVGVRALCPEATLRCNDLDEITTEEDVKFALKEQCELGEVQMTIRIRNGPDGTKVASIKLPVDAANKALKVEKICVGWSVCPLSVSQLPDVCFKCLGFGHFARNCQGPDRSKLCRRCCKEGHKAKDCTKPPKCLICAATGDNKHPTGGSRCPAFKRASATKSQWKCDVAIISEPYQIPPGDGNWTSDGAKTAAIWAVGKYPIQEVVHCADEGFVIAKINGVFICSCYAPPRWTIEQFNRMLDKLTEELTDRIPVVVAGDFNAWAVEWGSRLTNSRGSSLLEALAKLNVDLANDGTTTTYRKDGRESIIDVTFCSPGMIRSMDWRVCEEYTHSDHQAIRYCVGRDSQVESSRTQIGERKWKTANFNKDVFVEALRLERNTINLSAEELTATLSRACDATMPRMGKPRNGRRPAYWWNSTISDLRASCLHARRRMQRARNSGEREERRLPYRIARAALNKAIRLSKKECLEELNNNANENPWGNAYKMAMANHGKVQQFHRIGARKG
ncbi:uncharacterized protein LOC131433746 [Malaya genurostris]|uniref:uncharacterized protein LOC131433746 n=1 Tax=Malaya genurostris TaxID=325434 RepID=UPI0026F3FB42|nr:uncharacterized protein LOC131433746 [Malaya genurostris]